MQPGHRLSARLVRALIVHTLIVRGLKAQSPPAGGTQPWRGQAARLLRSEAKRAARAAYGVTARLPQPAPATTVTNTSAPTDPRQVAVIGADHKFITGLATRLNRQPDLHVDLQPWPRWSAHPPLRLARQAQAADVIVAEWTRQNTIWASHHKRAGQLLITRLHRFELDSPYPALVDIDAVDAVVYIAPWFGGRIRDQLGWPTSKLVYIPNWVDLAAMCRPKLAQPQFRLGLAGGLPQRKRLDLALDLLRTLRREDARFSLSVRMPAPWQLPYVAKREHEMQYFSQCYQRIHADPLLRGAVSFDGFSPDVSSWLRGVGHILSCADSEGSPVAVAEAMASGAVPVVRDWPGAREVLDGWVATNTDAAAAAILAGADLDLWWQRSQAAQAHAWASLDPARVLAAWAALLQGELAQARSYFPTGQIAP